MRIIDGCLKLHGLLCPPEFIPFPRDAREVLPQELPRRDPAARGGRYVGLDHGLDALGGRRGRRRTRRLRTSLPRSAARRRRRRPARFVIPTAQRRPRVLDDGRRSSRR